jgi:hypothetical protein
MSREMRNLIANAERLKPGTFKELGIIIRQSYLINLLRCHGDPLSKQL